MKTKSKHKFFEFSFGKTYEFRFVGTPTRYRADKSISSKYAFQAIFYSSGSRYGGGEDRLLSLRPSVVREILKIGKCSKLIPKNMDLSNSCLWSKISGVGHGQTVLIKKYEKEDGKVGYSVTPGRNILLEEGHKRFDLEFIIWDNLGPQATNRNNEKPKSKFKPKFRQRLKRKSQCNFM